MLTAESGVEMPPPHTSLALFEVALARALIRFSRALLRNLVLKRARRAHLPLELFHAGWCLTPIGQSC